MTAKFYNNLLYIGTSILAIIVGTALHRIPQMFQNGIIIYFIATMLFFDHMSKDENISLETHGKVSATLFLIAAILIGIETKDGKVFLLFLTLPEVAMLYYVKNKLFRFLRREMFILFVVVWILQVATCSQSLREMELVLAIFVHMMLQWIMQNYVCGVEFQFRKNKEQETSLDDLLKVITVKKDEAKQAVKTKSDFLSNMSHEIRTPINGILGMNEMIQKETQEENIHEYADNIQNAGKMLLSIINDILDFSKIESGRMDIIPVEYQVSSLINDLINLFRSRLQEKKLELKLTADSNIPNDLYGDEVRIRQIVVNLLSNAVKYTDAGYINLSVSYERGEDDSINLCFAVKDSGRGIKKEDMDKLFETFMRVDQENNRNIEGTGLGLSITKRFVDMMQGEITVESEYGKGSTFYVKIPQQVVKDIPMGDINSHFQKSNLHDEHYHCKFIAPDAKILVVDDNAMNLAVAKGLLKGIRSKVTCVESGKACLERLREEEYHVILLDHMMPGMNGVETLKKIREENLAPDVPIIALTANAVSGAREMYFDYGFSDYLAKPISGIKVEKAMMHWIPDELIQRVSEEEIKQFEKKSEKKLETRKEEYSDILKKSISEKELEEKEPSNSIPDFIDMEKALMYSVDGEAGVVCNIKLYLENVASTRENLIKTYQENDYREYGIYAHALKSTSLTIGIIKLSELAKTMEIAGGKEDGNYIKVHHEQMIQMYDGIVEQLKEYVDYYAEEQDESEITEETDIKMETDTLQSENVAMTSTDEIVSLLDKLYQAAEEFDSVVLDELTKQLSNMHFENAELRKLCKDAQQANEDCEYLALSEIIQKMQQLCWTK